MPLTKAEVSARLRTIRELAKTGATKREVSEALGITHAALTHWLRRTGRKWPGKNYTGPKPGYAPKPRNAVLALGLEKAADEGLTLKQASLRLSVAYGVVCKAAKRNGIVFQHEKRGRKTKCSESQEE